MCAISTISFQHSALTTQLKATLNGVTYVLEAFKIRNLLSPSRAHTHTQFSFWSFSVVLIKCCIVRCGAKMLLTDKIISAVN